MHSFLWRRSFWRNGGAVLLLGVLIASCRTSRSSGGGRAEAGKLLESRDWAGAGARYERLAVTASDNDAKASALVGAARAKILGGDPRAARTLLYQARNLHPRGRIASDVHYWIAETYIQTGQLQLATRYYEKSLTGAAASRRQNVYAHLVFCATEVGNHAEAARYRRKLSVPMPSDIKAIVSGQTTRLARSRQLARAPNTPTKPRQPVRQTHRHDAGSSTPVAVYSRASWSARSPRHSRLDKMGKITRVTVHHSAGPSFWEHSHAGTAQHIRNIQKYHQGTRGWGDIGYHFVIDRTGKVWQGRDLRYQGAHAGGSANRGNVGVVVLGNYVRQSLRDAQIVALRRLIDDLSSRYGISGDRVFTHKELDPSHTACPGPALTGWVRQIRAGMARKRGYALGD